MALASAPFTEWLMSPDDGQDLDLYLRRVTERPPWMARAACRGVDRSLFFPERGGDGVKAKAICAGCPVRAECLDYALADVELRGTWGGTSPGERKALRRGIAG